MEKISVYRLIRKQILSGCLLLCSLVGIYGQGWDLEDSVVLDHPIRLVNRDPANNIYITDTQGNVFKLDSLGNLLANFAPSQYGQITTMEPWPGLRLFLYYENTQQYTFLDRYLAGGELNRFPPAIGFARIATASSDNQIWLIDDRAFSLIKYDFTFDNVSLERSFNQLPDALNLNPYYLKEYQNRLYMGDNNNGVLVFDNIGNFLHVIAMPEALVPGFINEEMYFVHQNEIHFINLYQDTDRAILLPAASPPYSQVLILGQRMALIHKNRIHLYNYSP